LRKTGNVDFFITAFRWAAVYALIGTVMVAVVGDAHGKYLAKVQPMKISAAEAIWNTERDSADFVVVAAIDQGQHQNGFQITVPKALSLLLYGKLSGGIEGLNDLQRDAQAEYGPGNYIPAVIITFWAFRFMVGIGFLMIFLSLLAVLRPWIKIVSRSSLFLKLLLPAMVLPYLANTFGWILTEEARQPWIVYGLQKVQDAVSPNLSMADVLFSLILFIVLLSALIGVTGWLMVKSGISEPPTDQIAE
jgi:cytochrome d ubiquinol oxidase subunit I